MNRINRIANGIRFIGGLTLIYILIQRTIHSWNAVPAVFYFTVLSNLILALLLISSPFIKNIGLYDQLRGPITLYLLITSIIYLTILDPLFTTGLYNALNLKTISVSTHHITMVASIYTHIIFPILILMDFLLFSQQKRPSKKDIGMALIFPLGYVTFHTLYGLLTGAYLYPFLDPTILGGFGVLFLVIFGLASIFSLLYFLLHHFRNMLQNIIYDENIKGVLENLYSVKPLMSAK